MNELQASFLPSIMKDVIKETEYCYKENNNSFTDSSLLTLYNVFGSVVEKSLELVEKDTVKKICLEDSTRFIYQVTGLSNNDYYIFPDINYCSCPAFTHFVITGRSQLTCKHVLACHLCLIMGRVESYEVSLTEFRELQRTIINVTSK